MNIPQLDGGYDQDEDYDEESESSSPYSDISDVSDEDDDVEQEEMKARLREGQDKKLRKNGRFRVNTRLRNKKQIKPPTNDVIITSTSNNQPGAKIPRRGRPPKKKEVVQVVSLDDEDKEDSCQEEKEEGETKKSNSFCSRCKKEFEDRHALLKHNYWCESSRITRSRKGDSVKPSLNRATKRKESANSNAASSSKSAKQQSKPAPSTSKKPGKPQMPRPPNTPNRKRGRPRKKPLTPIPNTDEIPTTTVNHAPEFSNYRQEKNDEEEEEEEKVKISSVNEAEASYSILVDETEGPAVCPKCKMRYRNFPSLQKHLPACNSSGSSSEEEQASEEEEEDSILFSQLVSSEAVGRNEAEVERLHFQVPLTSQLANNTSETHIGPAIVPSCSNSIYAPQFLNNVHIMANNSPQESMHEHFPVPQSEPPQVSSTPKQEVLTTVTVQDPATGQCYRMDIPIQMVSAAILQQHPQIAASLSQSQSQHPIHQEESVIPPTHSSQSETRHHSSPFVQAELQQQRQQTISQTLQQASAYPSQVQEMQNEPSNRLPLANQMHEPQSQNVPINPLQLHQMLQHLQSPEEQQQMQSLVRPSVPQMMSNQSMIQHLMTQNSLASRQILQQQPYRPNLSMISQEPSLMNNNYYSQLQQNSLQVPLSHTSPRLENFGSSMVQNHNATSLPHSHSSFFLQGNIPNRNFLPQQQYSHNMNLNQQFQLAQQQAFMQHQQQLQMQQLQMQYLTAQQCQSQRLQQQKQGFQLIPPNSSYGQENLSSLHHINDFTPGSQTLKLNNQQLPFNSQNLSLVSSSHHHHHDQTQNQVQPRTPQIIVQHSSPNNGSLNFQQSQSTTEEPLQHHEEQSIPVNQQQEQQQQQQQQQQQLSVQQIQVPLFHQLPSGGIVMQQQQYPIQTEKYRRVLPLPAPRPIEPKPALFNSSEQETSNLQSEAKSNNKPKTIKEQLASKILEKNGASVNSSQDVIMDLINDLPIHSDFSDNSDLNLMQTANQRKNLLTAVVRPMEHPLQKLSEQISQIGSQFSDSQQRPQVPPTSLGTPRRPLIVAKEQKLSASPSQNESNEPLTLLDPAAVINGPPTTPKAIKRRIEGGKSPAAIKVTLRRLEGADTYSVNDVTGGDTDAKSHFVNLKIKARSFYGTTGENAGILTDVIVEPKIHIIPDSDELDSNFTIPEDQSSIPIPPVTKDETQSPIPKLTHRAVVLYHVKVADTNIVTFRSSDVRAVWSHIFEAAQGTRINHDLPPISYPATPIFFENPHEPITTFNMAGLTHRAIQFLLQYLPKKNLNKSEDKPSPPANQVDDEVKINETGCARTEVYAGRKPFDMFGWLASKHRKPLEKIASLGDTMRKKANVEMSIMGRYRAFKEKSENTLMVMWSTIHGRGLYNRRDIEKGEIVIEYAGEVIRSPVCDQREKYYETKGIGCYMFRIDDEYIIDATMKGNAARFINHSCDPNCESRAVRIEGKEHILILALRRVSTGEELTYDYKFEKEENKIPCACFSRKCKKYLN